MISPSIFECIRTRRHAFAPADPFALPPVSTDNPCGPDLDLAGDPDFFKLFGGVEASLPGRDTKSFYKFKRASIDFPASLRGGEKLLSRTLDMRLIVLIAKLSNLDRDLPPSPAGRALWA